ncbi:hypothetical protein [Rathayibacter festucae]|nr:hypothetical protein [Rathayibacter festucae]MDY0914099.1 hypothetical protein [Rathayibacter festucae]
MTCAIPVCARIVSVPLAPAVPADLGALRAFLSEAEPQRTPFRG